MSTFVGFHAKKVPLLRNCMLNPKKSPLLSDFTLKKRSTFEEFYAKPKKRSTFVGFHAKKGPLLRNFTLNKKKVHFCRISR